MARLLKSKFNEIERSLNAIVRTPTAKVIWEAIKAVEKPDLTMVADWAKSSLSRYADVAQEITRRAAGLSLLSHSAGVAYTFWKLATAEIQQVGSFDRVD